MSDKKQQTKNEAEVLEITQEDLLDTIKAYDDLLEGVESRRLIALGKLNKGKEWKTTTKLDLVRLMTSKPSDDLSHLTVSQIQKLQERVKLGETQFDQYCVKDVVAFSKALDDRLAELSAQPLVKTVDVASVTINVAKDAKPTFHAQEVINLNEYITSNVTPSVARQPVAIPTTKDLDELFKGVLY
jgi:hypothetical protein